MVVVPAAAELSILTTLVSTGELLDGAKVHLFQNDLAPNPQTAIGDFSPCDFSGYAPSSAVAWGPPGYTADGSAIAVAGSKQFQAANPLTVPNIVYGWYLTDAGGTMLLASRRFDAPFSMALALQILEVQATFPIDLV